MRRTAMGPDPLGLWENVLTVLSLAIFPFLPIPWPPNENSAMPPRHIKKAKRRYAAPGKGARQTPIRLL